MKLITRPYRIYTILCLLVCFHKAPAQLVADFSATPVAGCAPLIVSFTDASTGSPDAWEWDLGNGTTSFFQNPSVTYFNPGIYTVKLIIKKGSQSATEIKTQFIHVYASPVVNFSPSVTTGCFPLNVIFANTTTAGSGTISDYLWDFGDGSTSTDPQPGHTYNNPGDYNVSLKATNSFGCATNVTKPQLIKITGGVKAGFTMGAFSSCQSPATVTFTDTSKGTGTLSYVWDFGDGGTSTVANPTHTYTNPGNYAVSLTVSNGGCADVFVKQNVIIGSKADFTAPATNCANENITFSNTSGPAPTSVSWDFGDGTNSTALNPVKKFTNPGTYQVKLVASFGNCQDIKTQSITIVPRPSADFSATPNRSCKAPFPVTFTGNAGSGVTYQWEFGDGGTSAVANPTHTYTTPGIYTVKLTVTNNLGCKETVEKPGYIVIIEPRVGMTNGQVKECVPYLFQPAVSVTSITPIVSYEWDFGDGGTATGLGIAHSYTVPGTYTVKLKYTTSDGCTNTMVYTDHVKVGTLPVVNFSANPTSACASDPISFTDLSTGTNIDEWLWKFGDGGTSIQQNPKHVYTDTGFFSVSLTVWDNGCKNELVIPKIVRLFPPVARFKVDLSCSDPYRRVFLNESIVNRSLFPLTWFWEFGDGATSTQEAVAHTYSAPGRYLVRLTVVNGGCSYTSARWVTIIDDNNTFTASENVVCPGTSVRFDLALQNINNIGENIWSVDYNPTLNDSGILSMTQTFNTPGTYTIRVFLTDINKCSKVYPQQVKVIGTKAQLDAPPAACINSLVTVNDLSITEPGYPIVSRVINYGDGSPDETNPPVYSHTYTGSSSYTVKLIVTDSKGCVSSASKNIIIANPLAEFRSNDTMSCTGKDIAFAAQGSSTTTYQWDFGDGQTGTGQRPKHQYTQEGIYTVQLNIRDQYGCTHSKTRTSYIEINDPVAQFNVNATQSNCPPLIVSFTNNSLHVDSLLWDFGDGNTSTISDPQHFYTYPGDYWPILKVVSKGGCVDIIQPVKIEIKGPTGSFQYANKVGCAPFLVNFDGQSPDVVSYLWDFNDGATDALSGEDAAYTYTRPGKYLPRMIIKNADGCSVPILGPDSIEVYDVQADFIFDKQILCDRGIVQLTDQSFSNDSITGYAWQTGDGGTGSGASFSYEYTSEGDYIIGLQVTTQHGCTSSASSTVPVKVVNSPVAGINATPPACVPATFTFMGQLQNANPYPLTWQWDFANGQTSNVQDPLPILFNTAGNYPVTLRLTNSYNCADTITYMAIVHPLPDVDAGNDIVVFRDSPKMLQPSGAVQYVWSPDYQLSCTHCATPLVNPPADYTYYVEGESAFGCKASDSVRVVVQQRFMVTAAEGDTLCLGDQFRLFASGADQYSWSPASSLDNPASANPVARPQTTSLYQVVGRDNNNCFTDTAFVSVVVYPYPTAELGEDKTVVIGNSITLAPKLSSDITFIQWQPATWLSCTACPAPVVTPKQTSQYRILVKNQGGCITEDDITLFVVCGGENMFMPNTFSPNDDGMNDVFYPRGKGVAFIKSFRIFDRWGEKMFEQFKFNTNDPSRGWNGFYNGAKAAQDVYVYIIEVVCDNGQVLSFKGDVTLLR